MQEMVPEPSATRLLRVGVGVEAADADGIG